MQDCFWHLEDNRIRALCTVCAVKKENAWYWHGSELGYGDYNVVCSICNKIIHERENEDTE